MRACEICGNDAGSQAGGCTNGRCSSCHGRFCTPGGMSPPATAGAGRPRASRAPGATSRASTGPAPAATGTASTPRSGCWASSRAWPPAAAARRSSWRWRDERPDPAAVSDGDSRRGGRRGGVRPPPAAGEETHRHRQDRHVRGPADLGPHRGIPGRAGARRADAGDRAPRRTARPGRGEDPGPAHRLAGGHRAGRPRGVVVRGHDRGQYPDPRGHEVSPAAAAHAPPRLPARRRSTRHTTPPRRPTAPPWCTWGSCPRPRAPRWRASRRSNSPTPR